MSRIPIVAALLFAGCVSPSPASSVRFAAAPSGTVGACDPTEYFLFRKQPAEASFRVTVDEQGGAREVELTRSIGLAPEETVPARDVVRHVFRCRNRLAADAPRVVPYTLRYAELEPARVDAAACGRSVAYPYSAELRGVEADVKVGVTLDETGRVTLAWVDHTSAFGFAAGAIDALAHRCHFTAARAAEGPVPFFLVYQFHFMFPR